MSDNSHNSLQENVVFSFLFFLTLVLCWWMLQPPEPVSITNADQVNGFSAERAFAKVETIAAEPHMIGSEANAKVRDYLLNELESLGLKTELQETTAIYEYPGLSVNPVRFAKVKNVLGYLKGKDSSLPAVALMSHYDSVPTANGAGDAASGTAAILETVKVITGGEQLLRDVYIVLTDGEEIGLMGAQGFLREHPWAKKIGLLLNFEARGTSGLSNMFETSTNNAWLTKEYQKAASAPSAGSLSYEIYQRMRNDTDVSIAHPYGIEILNFAFIDGYYDYHQPTDVPANLSKASLQHHGEQALSSTKHFANLAKWGKSSQSATYFNLTKNKLVHYQESTAKVLSIIVVLFSLFTLWVGRKLDVIDVKPALLSSLLGLLFIVLIAGLIHLLHGWTSNEVVRPRAKLIQYDQWMWAFALVSFVLFAFSLQFLSTKLSKENVVVGGWLIWTVLLAIVTYIAPNAAYLFLWPLIIVLIAQHFDWLFGLTFWALGLAGLFALFFWGPTLRAAYLGLGIYLPAAMVVLFCLVLWLLAVWFDEIPKSVLSLVLAVSLIACIYYTNNNPYSERMPKPTEVYYLHDADNNTNQWVSHHSIKDEWSKRFMGDNPETVSAGLANPNASKYKVFTNSAKDYGVKPTVIQKVSQQVSESGQKLVIKLLPQANTEMGWLYFSPDTKVLSASVDGKKVDVNSAVSSSNNSKGIHKEDKVSDENTQWWRWRYYGLGTETAILEFELENDSPFVMKMTEMQRRWPEGVDIDVSRPVDMMPRAWGMSDSTVITQTFRLE